MNSKSSNATLHVRYLALKIAELRLKITILGLKVRHFVLKRLYEALLLCNFVRDIIHGNPPFLF
jgi:hypothetical protein